MEIIPSILGKNFDEVSRLVNEVAPFVSWVQLDISDGAFTPNLTWPYAENEDIRETRLLSGIDDLNIELHLMIDKPETQLSEDWFDLGVKRIIFHYESTGEISAVIKKIRDSGLEAGIALNMATPIDVVENFIDKLAVIQLMAISSIGYYGAKYENSVLKKIRSLRERYPSAIIGVDGGVTVQNAKDLLLAGADNLAVGSAIQKSKNKESAILEMQNIVKNHESSIRRKAKNIRINGE